MVDSVQYEDNGDLLVVDTDAATPTDAIPLGQHGANLAEHMDQLTLSSIATKLTEELSHDQNARADFEKLAARYIDALGVGPESDPDDTTYEFADTSNHPLLLKALTNFQAKALSALMPSPTQIADAVPAVDLDAIDDPAVRRTARAQMAKAVERVRHFYNWYLLKALPSYEEDLDLIIHECGLQGLGIRRVGVDPSYSKTPVRPLFVALEDLIISYDTKSFRTGRLSHRRKETATDLVRAMQNGVYRVVDVVPGVAFEQSEVRKARDRVFGVNPTLYDEMGSHTVYDVFTYLFLNEDPHPQMFARPYVVTIHAQSQEVLSIRRNWLVDDPDETPLEHFAGYVYSPGRNAVTAMGLGALLTNITLALRKAQRRALDAAYLANHPSGFIVSGMSIRDDATPFTPGELRPVDVGSGDIRQSIMMNPFPGPDAGLMGLYDRMNEAGKELGNIASIDFAAMMKSGIAAGPALAAYDESTEFQTSVHRRLYRGHATELSIIHDRMREIYGGQKLQFGQGRFLEPEDLLLVDVVPAMKPGHVSRQRALMEAQSVYEISVANPQEVNKREAMQRLFEAMGVQQIDDLILPDPNTSPPPATDPVNEYLRVMRGEPIRPAPQQNHRAHIDAHVSQMRGLQASQLPVETGQLAAAALAAHIAEHEALDLMVQVSARLGLPIEALMEGLPPEMEAEIAPELAAVIAEIENARRPKEDQDPRIIVEQIRSETKLAIEQIQAQHKELDRQAKIELRRIQEEAATYRNITDNRYAIEIAELGVKGKPPVKPDIPAPPEYSPNTPVPRFRMEPR